MNSPIEQKDWEDTTERFVCFIDIMGFKDMMLRNPHDEIYEMMKKIRFEIDSTLSSFGEDRVRITFYSDSIMISSKDNSTENIDRFIECVSVMNFSLLLMKIPHKGAVAFGKMTLNFEESIFLGQPLIDAILLHDELDFYGIVLHGSADAKLKERNWNYLFKYNIPLKKSSPSEHTCISPLFIFYNNSTATRPTENNFGLLNNVKEMRFITSGSLRKYIDNTIVYLNAAVDDYFR